MLFGADANSAIHQAASAYALQNKAFVFAHLIIEDCSWTRKKLNKGKY